MHDQGAVSTDGGLSGARGFRFRRLLEMPASDSGCASGLKTPGSPPDVSVVRLGPGSTAWIPFTMASSSRASAGRAQGSMGVVGFAAITQRRWRGGIGTGGPRCWRQGLEVRSPATRHEGSF
ncbi:hypothetical protein BU16DRAFT_329150 [Lophium mytilinum]|uniref:Uncharacterized protein n=1 Tax=Lophium mytilinum TaxID=390894 RepID=A0A6A6QZP7_9PEZI|nr:hypothetical protein BU16DRAFT_329150 [Lophium mytilinum]